jgi:hypothetical protein
MRRRNRSPVQRQEGRLTGSLLQAGSLAKADRGARHQCSAAKADLARSLSAAEVIDYPQDDFADSSQRYILDMGANASLAVCAAPWHGRELTSEESSSAPCQRFLE